VAGTSWRGCCSTNRLLASGDLFCHTWRLWRCNLKLPWQPGSTASKGLEIDRSNHLILLFMWDVAEPPVMSDDVETYFGWDSQTLDLARSVITFVTPSRKEPGKKPTSHMISRSGMWLTPLTDFVAGSKQSNLLPSEKIVYRSWNCTHHVSTHPSSKLHLGISTWFWKARYLH